MIPAATMNSAAEPVEASGRILVVDDEPNICRLLERYLGRLGHVVQTASSVPEAVERLTIERFDLVLTDLRLPGPSGLDLLVEVKSRAPGTRMILMSAHAAISAAAAAIDRGIDQLIIKPFELDDLRSRVASSLARHRAEHEALSLREAAYLIAVERVSQAEIARGYR
jgi:two-component system, NtrC family, response regulator GlrR